ncbi:MAG TPA: helix-turn-helix domain-containing protein, partial [Lysobacter sp.]|nr:helix-turn-helix domain-containing protein [Lysobacter sp.]
MTTTELDELDAAIAAAEERLAKLRRLWHLKRSIKALELSCAGSAPAPARTTGVEDIVLELVCQEFHVSKADIFSRERSARVFWPRFVAMQLVHEITQSGQSEIGRFFGRDHGSVANALRQLKARMDT